MRLISYFWVPFAICATSSLAEPAPVERSSLFELAPGEAIEDSGVINVSGGRFGRREAFEIVRRTDGGRTITSVITGENDAYRVEGRWTYDAEDHATGAVGAASYDGEPASIRITAEPPLATISVSSGSVDRSLPAPCDPDCLVDMAPSVLPMFTMTRVMTAAGLDRQTFRWIGQGLISDQVLLEGVAELKLLGRGQVGDVSVLQYRFVEKLTDAETGQQRSFAFNLWADTEQRPLAFGMASGTLGVREGFEAVPRELPGQF